MTMARYWMMAFFFGLFISPASGQTPQKQPAQTAGVATTPSAKVETIGDGIPIVYLDYESPRRLSPEQTQIVVRAAAQARPKDRQTWFVLVLCNSKPYWNISVYYSPDKSSARVRRGQCARISKDFPDPALVSYVLVSQADAPFGEKLDVPGGADLPLRVSSKEGKAPAPMSDEELAALVDFARPIFQRANGKSEQWRLAPIHRISVDGDSFEISCGWVVAMLDASLRVITVQKQGGKLTQVGTMKFVRS
jgi:hypothetical protein